MEQIDRPKGGGALISCTAVIAWCIVGLAAVMISLAFGGSEYKNGIFDNVAIATCITGIIGGNILCRWGRHQDPSD